MRGDRDQIAAEDDAADCDAAFKRFWSAQCRKGDPARNTHLTSQAFEAGWKGARGTLWRTDR